MSEGWSVLDPRACESMGECCVSCMCLVAAMSAKHSISLIDLESFSWTYDSVHVPMIAPRWFLPSPMMATPVPSKFFCGFLEVSFFDIPSCSNFFFTYAPYLKSKTVSISKYFYNSSTVGQQYTYIHESMWDSKHLNRYMSQVMNIPFASIGKLCHNRWSVFLLWVVIAKMETCQINHKDCQIGGVSTDRH